MTDFPEYNTLRYSEPTPGLGELVFHRPDRLNAITPELIEELHDLLGRLETRLGTRVLILTGAGRAFCAGFDLKSANEKRASGGGVSVSKATFDQRRLAELVIRMRKIPQPIAAAVNGVAAGGGFSFAMACDIRIADPSARFIGAFVNIGLSAGEMGSTYFLPRLVGVSRAAEILYTGRSVDAAEAERIGLVSCVSPEGGALARAREIAGTMLGKSPFGLRMTKEILNQNIDAQGLEAAIYLENRTQTLATRTEDFHEAVRAFVEKRPPKFGAPE